MGKDGVEYNETMDVNIGRDTLLALAAVAWADGTMNPKEAAGLRSAARQLSLGSDELTMVERSLSQRVGLDEVETLRMTRLTRLFTYAAATWIAELDGALSEHEETALTLLGDRLGLSQLARERARSVAHNNADPAGGDSYDLVKLRGRLSAGLSQIGDE
jgi:tellurite resistance protein